MKNLRIIFGIIQKHCFETGITNEECFAELEKLPASNSTFFPLYSYLRVLQDLGLIKLSRLNKVISLTEKGKTTDERSVPGLRAFAVLFLHLVRRMFILAFLWMLFWPALLVIPKQYNAQRNNV